MKLPLYRAMSALCALVIVGSPDVWPQQEDFSDAESRPVYMFIGGGLSAKHGDGHLPVVTMTKRHIVVDRGGSEKRISRRAPVLIQLRPVLTDTVMEVRDLQYDFSSTLPALLEAEAISKMLRYEIGTETEIALLENVFSGGGRRSRNNRDLIDELNRESEEFKEGVEGLALQQTFEAESLADTVFLSFELLPEYDYEVVYAAVAVSYETRPQVDSDRAQGPRRNTQVFASYIGDLTANEIKGVKIRNSLSKYVPFAAECEIFLFYGDGKQIAIPNSRGLREVGPERAQEIRNQILR